VVCRDLKNTEQGTRNGTDLARADRVRERGVKEGKKVKNMNSASSRTQGRKQKKRIKEEGH